MIVELSLAGEAPSWFILELQGSLHAAADAAASPFAGLVLGDVAPRPGVKGGVTLHVGANKLHGVVEALPAPLVVVRRQTRAEAAAAAAAAVAAAAAAAAAGAMDSGEGDGEYDEGGDDDEGDEGGGGDGGAEGSRASATRYVVAAVVRSRILFTERPQPVLGAAALAKQTQAATAAATAAAAATGGIAGGER